jgi:tRNA(fMet)-specific endonuclease VapC
MQVIDIMAAAIARLLGDCTVVTVDSDLSAVPGLTVENWRVTTTPPDQPR